jgi:hypothetical protein
MHTGGCISGAMLKVAGIAGREGCIQRDASREERRRFPVHGERRDACGRMHHRGMLGHNVCMLLQARWECMPEGACEGRRGL